jgi:hypothetical protein
VGGPRRRFHIPDGLRKFLLKHLRVPIILFWGRFFTWLPYRTPLTCVPPTRLWYSDEKVANRSLTRQFRDARRFPSPGS